MGAFRVDLMSVGLLVVSLYRLAGRVKDKWFSLLAGGAFAAFGRRTVVSLPIRLGGERRIAVGERVYVGADCWLQALADGSNQSVAISIGNGVSIAGACVISAVRRIVIEEDVLIARNVYISDHSHRYTQTELPVLAQGVDKIAPVVIRRGAWLGQNVVVCPGVTIGRGAVVGANSVVNRSIPDFTVAAGVPARVIRTIDGAGEAIAPKVSCGS
jgi:acetyltransferase-like isoleucine patch superfamily enzyme